MKVIAVSLRGDWVSESLSKGVGQDREEEKLVEKGRNA